MTPKENGDQCRRSWDSGAVLAAPTIIYVSRGRR